MLEYSSENMRNRFSKITYFFIKRVFDILFSFVMLLPLFILIIIVKIAYLFCGDYQSVIYKQKRVGKNGKEFDIYKFRTMTPDAEEELKELLKNSDIYNEWKEYHKLRNDPRITPLGLFLRRSSIDELPQFINVLKNDMSIIGPRPLVPGELKMHDGNLIYETVKPGLTGWWACNGRSNMNYSERLEYEYYYINNMSLLLDLEILFKTIACILLKVGAH